MFARFFRSRFFKGVAILLILLVMALAVFVEYYAPYLLISPRHNTDDKSPAYYGMAFENIELYSKDSLLLKGYWQQAAQPKGTVILVHGIKGFKEYWWWMDLPKKLLAQGYNVIAFDNRAHGKSGGKYCTYGYYEREDVSKIVDYIEQRQPGLPIALWGHSLGGCIAMMSLEHDQRIDVGVIESTFTDMNQIVADYQGRMFGFGIRPLSDYVVYRAGMIAQFNPKLIKPIQSAKNIHQPVFIAHGTADNKIHFHYGKELHSSLGSDCKEFYSLEGVHHLKIWENGGSKYQTAVLSFLEENMR